MMAWIKILLLMTGWISISDEETDKLQLHENNIKTDNNPAFLVESSWADSVLNSMTLEEKIGQLFMVAAYSNKDKTHEEAILGLIENQKIGGLIFFQGGPVRQAHLTNKFQTLSDIPLMIGMDAEWGLGMRLDSVVAYPRQMALGAMQNASLVYSFGKETARQCKRLGVHVNFAPVVDINTNRDNPVIGSRAFGQNKERVISHSLAYMKGMQDNGVMANAKHFPGHGDTNLDSHKDLPVITHSKERLLKEELQPFKELMNQGLMSTMVAHLHIPALDPTENRASTLSPQIVAGLLKKEMGFKGLVFTDALNMQGVAKYYSAGEINVQAIIAGNDVLLFPSDVPEAIEGIKKAIDEGKLSTEDIDKRVHKILKAKAWLGLNQKENAMVKTENLWSDLNSSKANHTALKMAENSVTLLKNEGDLLPLKRLDTLRIANITIGNDNSLVFNEGLNRYANVDHFFIKKKPSEEELNELLANLSSYNLALIDVHAYSYTATNNYGVPALVLKTTKEINDRMKTVVSFFGNAYALNKYFGLKDVPVVIMGYENLDVMQDAVSQGIFGGIGFSGKLPVDASAFYKEGLGLETMATRLHYTYPEEINVEADWLNKIDTIALEGIKEGAYPGCQIMAIKSGNVIFSKNYGYHTYEKKKSVKSSDLYDLASVTKIAASTMSVMRLQGEGKIHVDSTLGTYLSDYVDSSAYEDVVLRHMMTHQAGFFPWIPFFKKTMSEGQLDYNIYSRVADDDHPIRVANEMYLGTEWKDTIFNRIIREPLRRKKYKYSDFGFYFLKEIIARQSGMPLDAYVNQTFYEPLGLQTMGFNPRNRFPLDRITPAENDQFFRKQIVHGDVHDQGAAMLGGVSGHAGLFSNANDLGVMFQVLVNGGEYGGEKYLDKDIIKDFTSVQFPDNGNRRGVGFDKPVMSGTGGPTYDGIVKSSYGHSGFTGTYVWADPVHEVVYVFLSNRCYPDAENKKILRLNTRTDIQEVIYKAVQRAKK